MLYAFAICNCLVAKMWEVRAKMTVRITSSSEGGRTLIGVEGQLTAKDTSVLEEECRSGGFPQRLDLSGLLSAGVPIPEGAPVSTQERAYTSPIWYTP